jgi:hypothetical protein
MSRPHPFHGDANVHGEDLWPDRKRPAGTVVGIAFMAVLTLLFGFGTVVAFAGGDVTWAVMSLYTTMLCGQVLGLGLYLRWRPLRLRSGTPRIRRTGDGHTGIAFRYSGWGYFWYFGLFATGAAGLVPFALLGLGEGVAGSLIAVTALLAALFLVAVVVIVLVRAPGRLILTPDGLWHRGLTFTGYSPWEAAALVDAATVGGAPAVMVHVDPSERNRSRSFLPAWLGIREQELLPFVVVRDQWLATDPALVYRTVRHYHLNPGDRVELGTEAAVERVRQRRFLIA